MTSQWERLLFPFAVFYGFLILLATWGAWINTSIRVYRHAPALGVALGRIITDPLALGASVVLSLALGGVILALAWLLWTGVTNRINS